MSRENTDFITHRHGDAPLDRPQTRRATGGGAGIWIGLVAVLLAGALGYVWYQRHQTEAANQAKAAQAQAQKSVPVVVAKAALGNLPIYIDALGSVTPLNFVTVRTRVDGELLSINFAEGQEVKEGDLLAQIDPRPFQVQLEQYQGQLARDQATLNNAKVELDRDQLAGDAISKQQLDTQAALVDQLQAALKIDQAQIDSAKLQLTYCKITAPIPGRVGLRTVDKGNIIHATDQNGLCLITQVHPIDVLFTISEDQLPSVLKHFNAGEKLSVEAYNRDLTQQLAVGVLAAIDNQVESASGTVRLKAEFTNQNNALYPNQFVNVRLLVDTIKGAVIVPAAAVQHGPDNAFVYVVKADDTVEMKTVTPGATEGERTVIQEGFDAGAVVVTDGVDKLAPGVKVAARQPATQRSTTRANSSAESSEAGT